MIVVDTNLIGYLYLNSDYSPQAEKAFLKDSAWIAPLLWRSEFRNVLAMYIRKNLLSLGAAYQVMDAATEMMQGREYDVNSLRVLELVAESSCSAYDCEFVALAQDLNIPLITVDHQILAQFPQTAVSVKQFIV